MELIEKGSNPAKRCAAESGAVKPSTPPCGELMIDVGNIARYREGCVLAICIRPLFIWISHSQVNGNGKVNKAVSSLPPKSQAPSPVTICWNLKAVSLIFLLVPGYASVLNMKIAGLRKCGNIDDISIYGQNQPMADRRLAKRNELPAIRGIIRTSQVCWNSEGSFLERCL